MTLFRRVIKDRWGIGMAGEVDSPSLLLSLVLSEPLSET
jgi:hypothetical protein